MTTEFPVRDSYRDIELSLLRQDGHDDMIWCLDYKKIPNSPCAPSEGMIETLEYFHAIDWDSVITLEICI